jgi:hypothetical protein
MEWRPFALLLVLCAFAQRHAGAQDSSRVDDLRPGMRVRFRAPAVAPDRFLGTIRWLTPDSIALDTPDHRLVTVPRSPITTMEISLGASRMRAARRGLMWGVPIGVALGAFVTSGLRDPAAPRAFDPCDCKGETTRRSMIIDLTIISAVLGGDSVRRTRRSDGEAFRCRRSRRRHRTERQWGLERAGALALRGPLLVLGQKAPSVHPLRRCHAERVQRAREHVRRPARRARRRTIR